MQWLANPWLLWGVGPLLASNIGFFVTAAVLELLLSTGAFDAALIHYKSSNKHRKQLLAATQQRIPFWKQVRGCTKYLVGPSNIVNAVVLSLLIQWAKPHTEAWLPNSLLTVLWQLLALAVVTDFGLYWGHRVQHEVEWLWKLHAKHHAIDTPTPFSTLFINPIDAALQGSIPFGIAVVFVRPEPLVLYAFLALRMGENALNHSGLNSQMIDLLTLKSLPFRASIAHHDAHHKYSNHAYNAKNYGESFWVWDWFFGTCSSLAGITSIVKPL